MDQLGAEEPEMSTRKKCLRDNFEILCSVYGDMLPKKS
uniref:Uncharacterized protein n=1 Tax=Moniliophthora roreri TaxID=221103 RepID=A0A0W0G128_MONRR